MTRRRRLGLDGVSIHSVCQRLPVVSPRARLRQNDAMSAPSIPFSSVPEIDVARGVPRAATIVGVAVGTSGSMPRSVGLGRRELERLGFSGRVGQTLVVPRRDGPAAVAVGVGAKPDAVALRDAAAAF